MKIEVEENRTILVKEVYNNFALETWDGERLSICMRDSGYELNYNGKKISLKKDEIKTEENLQSAMDAQKEQQKFINFMTSYGFSEDEAIDAFARYKQEFLDSLPVGAVVTKSEQQSDLGGDKK